MKSQLGTEQMSDAEYKTFWKTLGPIEIKMVEKHGECRHEIGDTFYYENPYRRPEGVCVALLNMLDVYAWRAAMGVPSWNGDDRTLYRLHCPDATGTVWEMRKVESQGDA